VSYGTQLTASTRGRGDAGNVIINARDRISFDGTSADGQFISAAFSTVEQGAIGRGGNIEIDTGSLSLTNGAGLTASTRGQGDAGSVIINARDRISFDGGDVFSSVDQGAIGHGGNIEIDTGSLSLTNGAQLTASTRGRGNAGSVIINARDAILLQGTNTGFSSGIFTSTVAGSSGRGGDIEIQSDSFRITDGAVVDARTGNFRRGGNVVISTEQFEALNGGQIIATALRRGRAGSITLNADRITLSGSDPTFPDRLEQFPNAIANEGNGESGLFASTRAGSTGRGGDITLNAADVVLNDGASITARSQGQGSAGNIAVNTRNQTQLTNSNITTESVSSSGGNITINTADQASTSLLILRGDSDILTQSQRDGGDITVQGIATIAFDDSDIITRSADGSGGDITLSALFSESVPLGSADDYDDNDQVDLNAEGQIASGIITINDTSFVQNNLSNLTDTAVNADSLIANSCIARTEQGGTFLMTGSGGLPERPGQLTISTYPTSDVQPLPSETLEYQQFLAVANGRTHHRTARRLSAARWSAPTESAVRTIRVAALC